MSLYKKYLPKKIICISGEQSDDLFIIHKGKLMIFVNQGTKITPIAYLGAGEYVGELSFFDKFPRSAHIMTVEETTLIQISSDDLSSQFPPWLRTIAESITKKIRHADELIRKRGIRRQNVDSIKPLTIEDQREYYKVLEEYAASNDLTLSS